MPSCITWQLRAPQCNRITYFCGWRRRWALLQRTVLPSPTLSRAPFAAPVCGLHPMVRICCAIPQPQRCWLRALHSRVLQCLAVLLRHRSLDTTAYYAKVDLKLLRTLAQPWPEVSPC